MQSLTKAVAASGRSALSGLVGNTPLLRVSEPLAPAGRGFWAKLEGFNPGGIKDRPGLHMVERARARGDLKPGGRIIESISGTLGLGLALAGMVHGHPVTLVTDPGLELSMTRLLTAHGAQVDVVSEPHPAGGWQQPRRERVQRLLEQHPGSWCPDQYNNPDNVSAYTPLALELASEMGHIDVLVCSVGTGGHSAGVSRVLGRLYPGLTVVGVDTTGSTIFGQPAKPRLMRGLGSSIYPRNVAYEQFSEVHWVAPHEAVRTCRLVGMVLTGVDFRITCLVAAGIFALLSFVQIRELPARRAEAADRRESGTGRGVLAQWRGILANRPFLLFSAAMIGSYVLTFQVYLALPPEVRRLGGDGTFGTTAVAMLFAVSGLSTILGQTRVTAWCKGRYEPGQALVRGLAVMGSAFVPLLLATAVPVPEPGVGLWLLAAVPPTLAALLLAVGTMIACPFEMDTIVRLSGGRLVATHYGLYNTICGIGITAGNLATGAALDAARSAGFPALPWIALSVLGLACSAALYGLHRSGRLAVPSMSESLSAAV